MRDSPADHHDGPDARQTGPPDGADNPGPAGADTPPAGMPFVQVARLELDDILEQLLLRVREVQDTQGRLRGLLHAFLEVGRANTLDDVLRHVVDAARELVDARYAALGVVKNGQLVQFVHTGTDPDTVARIGHLPQGKGLLGLLVEHPQVLRLSDMAGHYASAGFPDGHPPMRTLLGVPIRDGDRIFGNLYLTDKRDGAEFTADDEQLVQALAVAAAGAITKATLLHDSQRRHTWQTAMIDVSTQLGSPSQSCCSASSPTLPSAVLTAPFRLSTYTNVVPSTGIASMYGTNTIVRYSRQPRMPSWRMNEIASAMIVTNGTDRSSSRLCRTAWRKIGSSTMNR